MAHDTFLQVDGVPGESTDTAHSTWIEILSFSNSIEQPVSISSATGGRTAERVTMSDFIVTKEADTASPKLMQKCCDGSHIPKVTLECCLGI